MDAQERVARILCRLMGDEWQLGEHLYRNTADEIIATLAPAPNVAPREAGEAAFYADEGNIPSCLKAAFDAYEAASGWQPIEAAPKDGTPILAYERGEVHQAAWGDALLARMVNGRSVPVCGWMTRDSTAQKNPTHWRPLPTPPALSKAKEG